MIEANITNADCATCGKTSASEREHLTHGCESGGQACRRANEKIAELEERLRRCEADRRALDGIREMLGYWESEPFSRTFPPAGEVLLRLIKLAGLSEKHE